jgi:hypothetical protein
VAFDFTNYHFAKVQTSRPKINQALDHWLALIIQAGGKSASHPWKKAEEMYEIIDSIQEGGAPWKTINFHYSGKLPEAPPKWML